MSQMQFWPSPVQRAPEPQPDPLVRSAGPATSYEAARKTRQRAAQSMGVTSRLVATVALRPGLTYRELGEALGVEHVEVMRRLTDKTGQRLFRKGPPRKCDVNGNKMGTWFLVEGVNDEAQTNGDPERPEVVAGVDAFRR